MTTAFSTINAPFKEQLLEEELARFIKSGILPDKYREHIFVFFTEVSVPVIFKFMSEQEVSLQEIKDYYVQQIKSSYRNRDLEDAFGVE